MSIELGEAYIIATQMQELAAGKTIVRHELRDTDRLVRSGFVNRDIGVFDALDGRRVREVRSRGSTVLSDCELPRSYIYKRDFLGAPDPRDPSAFPASAFDDALRGEARMLKAVLVGKDAVVVGLGKASFQDIAWRARVHPKRKVSDLGTTQRKALYRAFRIVIDQSIRKGGKVGFMDLRGKPGRYELACGPAAASSPCPRCGHAFAKVVLGGGPSYYCPTCQGEP